MEFDCPNSKVRQLIEQGKLKEAYWKLQSEFAYPRSFLFEAIPIAELKCLKLIAEKRNDNELAEHIQKVIQNPSGVKELYELGVIIGDRGLLNPSAICLSEAYNRAPNNINVLADFAISLEKLLLNSNARDLLLKSKALLGKSALLRYLLAFNHIMTGNIQEASDVINSVKTTKDEDIRRAAADIQGMINRALHLKETRSLDNADLRGWHMVLNGSILLHRSPIGFEKMTGRYALIQDRYELIHQGILRLEAVLKCLKIKPPRVISLPDRSSQILGLATSKKLKTKYTPWHKAPKTKKGLIVGYRGENFIEEVFAEISTHKPNQILWLHATTWTKPFHYSPDITTFLAQTTVEPWSGGFIRIDPESPRWAKQDTAPDAGIASRILETSPMEDKLEDQADLISLVSSMVKFPHEGKMGILRQKQNRLVQRRGSPVPSTHFDFM